MTSKYPIALLLLLTLLASNVSLVAQQRTSSSLPAHTSHARAKLSTEDDAFLEDLSRRAFLYFWEQADPRTGLVLDRAHTDGTSYSPGDNHYNVASSASTGF